MALTTGRTIKLTGTATAFSNEATTKVTANTVYQITDATKRVIDPSVAVVVEVDADGVGAGGYAVAAASTYVIDYLYGTVTFLSDQGANAVVRISGSYLPTLTVAKVVESKLTITREVPDSTAFDAGSIYRAHAQATLLSCAGDISSLEPLGTDFDAGGGTVSWRNLILNGTPVLYEETTDGTNFFRAWVVLTHAESNSPVEGLVGSSVQFESAAQRGLTAGSTIAGLGWGT